MLQRWPVISPPSLDTCKSSLLGLPGFFSVTASPYDPVHHRQNHHHRGYLSSRHSLFKDLQSLPTAYRVKGRLFSLILSSGPAWLCSRPSGSFPTHPLGSSRAGLTNIPIRGLWVGVSSAPLLLPAHTAPLHRHAEICSSLISLSCENTQWGVWAGRESEDLELQHGLCAQLSIPVEITRLPRWRQRDSLFYLRCSVNSTWYRDSTGEGEQVHWQMQAMPLVRGSISTNHSTGCVDIMEMGPGIRYNMRLGTGSEGCQDSDMCMTRI